ncbi:MAG: hypothetical protein AAFY72_16995 [Cyanobacteria bacterium J06649_4]
MFIPSPQSVLASTNDNALPLTLPSQVPPILREPVRHLLFGSPAAVQSSIRLLHKLGYADINDWSRNLSTGRADEVMAILTKRVRTD